MHFKPYLGFAVQKRKEETNGNEINEKDFETWKFCFIL